MLLLFAKLVQFYNVNSLPIKRLKNWNEEAYLKTEQAVKIYELGKQKQ